MKNFVKLGLGIALISNLAMASGIPVVDAAANTQLVMTYAKQVAEYAQTAKRWADTVTHYQSQIQAYTKELASKTGIRDAMQFYRQMQSVYKDIESAKTTIESLPEDLSKMTKLDTKADALINKFLKQDFCAKVSDSDKKSLCNAQRRSEAKNLALVEERIAHMDKYQKMLSNLRDNMQNNKGDQEDIKQSLDYANALQMISAQMQAEKMQLDMVMQKMEYEKRVQDQQRQEYFKKTITGSGVSADFYDD